MGQIVFGDGCLTFTEKLKENQSILYASTKCPKSSFRWNGLLNSMMNFLSNVFNSQRAVSSTLPDVNVQKSQNSSYFIVSK